MVTNPNTLGVFEENIMQSRRRFCTRKGALVYMDGANMNALVGIARPGDFGIDVMHLNLHKTFSTPHGGGGPGGGPVAVKKHLEPFLPVSAAEARRKTRGPGITTCRNRSAACARSTETSACWFARWPTSWRTAVRGLRNATMDAVLNANYIRASCWSRTTICRTTRRTCTKWYSATIARRRRACSTGDIAKRLIDYGFHPYTVSFPLIVHGALMIEPTETESKRNSICSPTR